MKAFRSYVDLDSVTVFCPCGAWIEGEGDCIAQFKKEHKDHVDAPTVETITADGKRAGYTNAPQ